MKRREFLRMTAAGIAAGTFGFPHVGRSLSRSAGVVMLGIDGMDPVLLAKYIEDGRMPNAQRLMGRGSLRPLRTSDPPQSPVAWANVISGTNPGGHGLFDFIARDPATLIPHFSMARIEKSGFTLRVAGRDIPLTGGAATNLRHGPVFWQDLGAHGIDCQVFRMPANFPPSPCNGRTVSGLGTPDIQGGYGTFTYYTSRKGEVSHDVPGGRIERIAIREDRSECPLRGPINNLDPEGGRVEVLFKLFKDPSNPTALVSLQGREFILKEGEWSDWVPVKFAMMRGLAAIRGICRFYLKAARNELELYVSPVNIDPTDPALPISTPADYSRQLAERLGPFHTQGMPEDTSALSAGVLDDDEYRHQALYVLDENARLFEDSIARFRGGFFFHYFSSLDLNSHVFWRTLDPGHPLYTPELAKKQGDFLPLLYERMDAVIGRAMKTCGDGVLLMIVSDHGFGSFRRQFNLNSWLLDNRYAKAVRGAVRGDADNFQDVEWSGTRAYGLGINGLYLNIAGREPNGTVRPGDRAESLKTELIARLCDVRDPATGECIISRVCRPREVYSGPYTDQAPDLMVCYNRNYRASWDTILGRYPREHVLDNTDAWSGDHTQDSNFLPGVFLCNRKVKAEYPALLDLAPSILSEFGVPVPKEMTGKSFV
ncbi:MAG: hypothetical protein E4H02_04775 [Lentisphaerales bacterium]|jgi:predicted AlkP superfamily phosphohydrolase/phosphomutase|nr:MAG: hypothetical protein E4H02_04775 [Lentisphaerales bacterium]